MRISDWSSDVCSSDVAVAPLGGEVDRRRRASRLAFDVAQVERAAEMPAGLADKDQGLAGAEGGAGDAVEVVDETDAAAHRRRQDGLAVGLVWYGRASCGERVCQERYISVLAV